MANSKTPDRGRSRERAGTPAFRDANLTALIATKLERAHDAFTREVDEIGEQVRVAIMPYFAEHKLTYMAGNGTWFIEGPRGETVEDDDLPKGIRDTLTLEVGRGNYLGYHVRDIKQADWRTVTTVLKKRAAIKKGYP